MKNKYTRLKWLAAIILAIVLLSLALPANAAIPNTNTLDLQQEVKGTVTDQTGMPLPGVTVTVKHKNRGTVTDIDGNYSINIAPEDVLVFSYIGFKTLEEPWLGRREIMIRLEEDISSLGEVQINAGYYSTTKRESTGNISRVTAEEIELQPVVSPIQALQGRMAGVEIIPGGNQPGMASAIRIRGRNSLREEGNFPLYIIDGVPINSTPFESNSVLGNTGIDPLNTLNLSNIESIEVLKDANATAIYGSRGANGVVLITTKKGMNRKTGLEARVYKGASTVPNRIDLLDTPQYLQLRRLAFENDGIEPTAITGYDLVLWDQNRYTDWQDFFIGGTSSITNVNLSTTGGNENTSFRLGGSYHNQGTVYPGEFEYQKITGNLNLNHTSENKKLTLDLSVNYGIDNNDLVGNVGFGTGVFLLPPNAPSVFLEDGKLNWEDWAKAGWNNPLQGIFNTSTTKANNIISGLGVSYELFKGLLLKTSAGYTFYNSSEMVKRPRRSYNPANWENIDHGSSHLDNYRKSWILEPQIVYGIKLGKGNLETLMGGTFQESESGTTGFVGRGYVTESLIGNLSAAQEIQNGTSQHTQYRYSAIFGRIGFNWDQKYIINLTGRRDGSSRFGPGNQLANFWAIGAAWVFSDELFFKEGTFLSFGKLRTSYGTTGSDQIGDYGYLDAYEATPGPGGLYPTQLANPDYSWEVNKKFEAGLELGFLKDRINTGMSYYHNRSSNQLVGYPLPSMTGFTTIQANLPATVQNTGLELELSSTNFQSRNFHWQTSINITFPKNELVSYPNIDQSSFANTYKVGHPLNISLLYQFQGINPETGFYHVRDVNEDGRIDFEDRSVIQDWGKEMFGGMNNSFTYKDISLSFLWDFVKQDGRFEILNAGEVGNQSVEVLRALNENSGYQTISRSPQAGTAFLQAISSSFSVVDASFLRLRNLSLGYSVPNSLLKTLRVEKAKIFFQGQNLLTLTNYRGMNPESPRSEISFAGLRTITGGLQLQF